MNTYSDNTGIDPSILNKSTRWKLVVGFKPWQLYLLGRNPNTHWTDDWVGPRTNLAIVVKRKMKNVMPLPLSNPRLYSSSLT